MKKVFNFKVLLPLLLITFASSKSLGASLAELQEVRLAKAELAYLDGNKKRALNILYQNISRKKFHLETYLFLAKIYFNEKEYAKGFRSYYYGIKQLHFNQLTKSTGETLALSLELSPKPSVQALSLYDRIAKKYFDLYETRVYPVNMDATLLKLSYKYYNILEFYKYKRADTKYMKGLISKRMKKYNIAIDEMLEAKELYIERDEQEARSEAGSAEDLDYIIGDLLIRQGHYDAGSIYLKTLTLSTNSSPSSREYANNYLESISQSYTSFGFNLGFSSYSNPNQLSDETITTFSARTASTYKRVTGTTRNIGLNGYYITEKFGSLQFINSFRFNLSNFLQDDIKYNDSKIYSLSTSLKYDDLSKSLIRLSYSADLIYYRPSSNVQFSKHSMIHTFAITYSHIFKFGLLSFKLPFTLSSNILTSDTSDIGGELSLTPYSSGDFWSPTFTTAFTLVQEDISVENSSQLSFYMSNHLKQSDKSSFFLDPSYTIYSNTDPAIAYNQISTSLSWSYYISMIDISQVTNLSWKNKSYLTGSTINETSASVTWSYSF